MSDRGVAADHVLAEAVSISRSYVESGPVLIEQTLGSARGTGGLDLVAPPMEMVGLYFIQPDDLVPDHLGSLRLLDDALYSNRMLEVLSASCLQLAGVPLVSGDLGPANRATAAFLGADVASTISAAVDRAVQQRVMEVELHHPLLLRATRPAQEGAGGHLRG